MLLSINLAFFLFSIFWKIIINLGFGKSFWQITVTFFQKFLIHTARKFASDPRVQKKAKETFHEELKPRAIKAWEEVKPRIKKTQADIKKIVKETNPSQDPQKFAKKTAKRVLNELKDVVKKR